ncbi:hypothetical protein MTO96_000867 [Rhipicephalus appendiculatus]
MSRREPFSLKTCILVYNLSATLFSAFFVCRFVKLAYWDLGYTFLQDIDNRRLACEPRDLALVLVVLHVQAVRTRRHRVLCAAQEGPAGQRAARRAPRDRHLDHVGQTLPTAASHTGCSSGA